MTSGISVKVPPAPVVHLSVGQAPVVRMDFNQGLAGPTGTWRIDKSFKLRQLPLKIEKGRIEIDFSEANTYYLLLTENVREVVYKSLPDPGVSVRVQLYLEQDSAGGRFVTGWPPGTQTPSGQTPILSQEPGALDSLVLDTFDGGATTQLNIVGQRYVPLATPTQP